MLRCYISAHALTCAKMHMSKKEAACFTEMKTAAYSEDSVVQSRSRSTAGDFPFSAVALLIAQSAWP